jgi:hypothetical protein
MCEKMTNAFVSNCFELLRVMRACGAASGSTSLIYRNGE